MSEKHTAGPWKLKKSSDGKRSYVESNAKSHLYEPIAEIPHDDITVAGSREVNANARLICASPDLLRALKDLREQVDAHVVVVGCSHFNTRLATEVIDRIEK